MNSLIPIQLIFIVFTIINLKLVQAVWKPKPGTTWNWDLEDDPNEINIPKGEYDVIDIDLYEVKKETIEKFHKNGLKVICYFSAGTYESFREECKKMLDVKGLVRTVVNGWENEKWLDIRLDGVKPFMTERINLAHEKGCDGVEFDNVDAYSNVAKVWKDPITVEDEINYIRWLAEEAHKFDLSVGLKNAIDLIKPLINDFDFAINEECADFNECKYYSTVIDKDMAVFTALYGLEEDPDFISNACKNIGHLNLSVIIKNPNQLLNYSYSRFIYEKHCEKKNPTPTPTTTTTKKTITTTAKITIKTTTTTTTTTKAATTATPTKKTLTTTTTKKASTKKTTIKSSTSKKTSTNKTDIKSSTLKKTSTNKTDIKSSTLKKTSTKKTSIRKTTIKSTTSKKTSTKKAYIKSTTLKKTSTKKTSTKKTSTKKTSTKKTSTKKAYIKSTTLKKTSTKKTSTKKATIKSYTSKKTSTKKTSIKKTTIKSTTTKKFSTKKSSTKKSSSKKTSTNKTSTRK